MQPMYAAAINYHIYAIILLVIVITLFYLYTQIQHDFKRYKILIRNWMPIYILSLSATIFTGIVMVAANNTFFSLTNLLMIINSIFLVILEVIRYKRFKVSSIYNEKNYITFAKRIYAIELLSIAITIYISKVTLLT